MISHHPTGKKGLILGVLFAALALSLPAPAAGEENAGREAIEYSIRDAGFPKNRNFRAFQMPDLEPVKEYGSFLGLKITLKLQGGWNTFSGNDIKKGIDGMYDNGVAAMSAAGREIVENDRYSTRGGIEVGGDLIYAVTPRFGIGVGLAGVSAWKESHLLFEEPPWGPGSFRSTPHVKVSTLRAGLFYSLPFAGFLGVSVRGGPAFYSAEYNCALGSSSGFIRDGLTHVSYTQKASAKQWGFEGGLGFELNPNRFVAIFIEVQGRYAKFHNLEGDETEAYYQAGQYRQSAAAGPVYIVDTPLYPQLDIIPSAEAVPGNARQATLDLSGVTYLAGLKFRL
jgi:hypothetical protein